MKVLVTHGSERGGTAEIAARVAETMRTAGHDVDLRAAREVRDVKPYEAVILGGALYAFRWHRDARRFVLRHAKALQKKETYLFSSGPLDDSASREEIPMIPQVAQLAAYVGARGHATFGGRLAPDAKGFPAAAMAKTASGDWRDWSRIEAWSRDVAAKLDAPKPARAAPVPLPSRAAPLLLSAFTGVTALGGGAVLVASPDGAIVQLPMSSLAHSPFASFLVPGLLLFTLVGALNVYAAWKQLVRDDFAAFWSMAAGCSLTIWIVTEMVMLRTTHWLQLGYLAIGVATIAVSWVQLRALFSEWADAARRAKAAQARTAHAEPASFKHA